MAGMGIGGINNINPFNQTYNSSKAANQLSSGKKINSAADDAAGLAIAKKLENQAEGFRTAADNTKDMRNLLNVADGGLNQIASGLERVRELKMQSMNGTFTEDDKKIFQQEINGILENVNDIGKNTKFNGKTLLDGSFTAQQAIVGANGEAAQINIGSGLAEELGVADFDVESGSVGSIDEALDTVLNQMAEVGAQTNRMEYSGRTAENMAYNQEVARSRTEDADIAQAAMENNRQKITEQSRLSMQRMQMEGMGQYLKLIG